MSYNTVQQFLNFSLTSGSFNGVPTGVVQEYLNVAQVEIDSALFIHHNLPFASGTVPEAVLEAERVITAYRLWLFMGIDPGTKSQFLTTRYAEITGNPEDPSTGWLGQLATGTRALVDPSNNDQQDTASKPSFTVLSGGGHRHWQQANGRGIR